MSDLYDKSLQMYKTSYSDADKTARELTISGCEMVNKGMQPTLAKCN